MKQDFERIFITSDQHATIESLQYLNGKEKLTSNDLVISCGDFGVPFFSASKRNKVDTQNSEKFVTFPCQFAILQGNHCKRFERVKYFHPMEKWGATLYTDSKFPQLNFLKNGEIYNINGHSFLIIGGGYSVDKFLRLERGWTWESEEQLNDSEKELIIKQLQLYNHKMDILLSHTAPYSLIPRHLFLSQVNQSTVDDSQEHWIEDNVYSKIKFNSWFFGHYHGDEIVKPNVYMVYKDYLQLIDDGTIKGTERLKNYTPLN